MPVFSKVRNFFWRHRNKFIVGGIILTGTVFMTRYAQQKIREWQERETKEFLERTRKQQHFESIERTCNQTILSLVTTLNESLCRVVNTEDIVAELRSNPANRVELWEKLKILVFTKVSTSLYVSVLLVVTLRIQLNILGGYLFRDSTSVSSEVQEKYLTICHNLMDTCLMQLSNILENEYTKIIGPMQLKRQLSLSDLENLFWAIQTTVAQNEQDPVEKLRHYVVGDNVPDGNDVYSCMVRDTADLLDSDEVKSLARSCISRGFSMLGDKISEFYSPPTSQLMELPSTSAQQQHMVAGMGMMDPSLDFVHPAKVKIALAKLIPIINGLVSRDSLPDNFVQQLLVNDKLKILGANIYELFCNSAA